MKRIEKKDVWILLAQLAVWFLIIILPTMVAFFSTHEWNNVKVTLFTTLGMLQSPMLLYFINFYLLQRLFFKRHYVWFALINIALLFMMNFGLLYIQNFTREMPYFAKLNMYTGLFVYMLLNIAMIATAIGLRHFMRVSQLRRQLMEEKQKVAEAELAWLKNQINPHFLFNTLNNISSLTQIDADAAQDAIAQLSDLLRYAMYETNKKYVPISGEVDFMRNYSELMRLRCNNRTQVDYRFDISNERTQIAPLLFISLIENAFKHGTSTNRDSSIDISLSQSDQTVTFVCDNTNYPKSDNDRSGSGIGLENTRRRLDLMYAEHYEWEQTLEDNIYHIRITIQL